MRIPFARRLGTWIFAAILMVSILGVLLSVGVLARQAGRVLKDEIGSRNLQIARLVAARAGLFYDESLNELCSIAGMFGPLPSAPWVSETLFANLSLEFRRFGWIRLLGADGTPVAGTGSEPGDPAPVPSEIAQRVSSGARYVSPVRIDENFTPFLEVGVPTKLADGSPGALFAELRLREIWQHLEGISIGPGAVAYLLSDEGVLIAHSDKRVTLTPGLREAVPRPPASLPDSGMTVPVVFPGQGEYLASYFRLAAPDWYAVVAQPIGEAYLPAADLARQAGILLAAVTAASIILGWLLSRQITMPLVQLVNGTLRVADGDLRHRISVRTGNEIGELAASFNAMTAALEERSRELAASERKYRLVTERANDIIFALDQEGRFTFASGRLRTLAGIEPAEVLGRGLADVMEISRSADWMRMMEPGASSGRVESSFLAELPTRAGKRLPLEVSVTRVADPDEPPGFSGVARDVSERRRLEEQLAQAQKMEAVGRLAGGIAHDFNNLLTAILGYCEMARGEIGENPSAEASLDQVASAGQRAAGLTRQLLAFSRRQVLTPRLLDLNEVVQGMAEMLRRLIGEPVALVTRLTSARARIMADKGQMEQVIMNLALNGRDAMPAGGVLTIATETAEESVMLEVTDTGTGMAPEVQAHLFEPFFTTKEQGKGTGLGLSTVYGIVQQASGTIAVESAVGRGTTVRVSFPHGARQADAVEELPARSRAGGSETILVVEDEEMLRDLMRSVLGSAGYRVILASDGRAALEAAGGAGIDLLATDLVLPGLGGRQVAEELRCRYPGLPVLFISGYTADNAGDYDRTSDGRAFLQKPFTSEVLLGRVRWLLDGAKRRAGGAGGS